MAVTVRELSWENGVYSARDVARYVALAHGELAGRRSRRWLREVVRPVGHTPYQADYTFDELISVLAIAELVEAGLSPGRIAAARERLSRLTGVEQPFALRGLFTDGDRLGAQLGRRGLTDLDAGRPIDSESRPAFAPVRLDGVAFKNGTQMQDRQAVAWSPRRGVTLDPRVHAGIPCLTGSGYEAWVILSRFERGTTLDELCADHDGFDVSAIAAAIDIERRLREMSL